MSHIVHTEHFIDSNVTWFTYAYCYYICQQWIRCYRNRLVDDGLVSTMNGVDEKHEHLKYSVLADCSSGKLSDLMTAVARQLVPFSQCK